MYGPYILNSSRYYVYEGEVYDKSFEEVEMEEVENLHEFYLKTYMNPLFFAPFEKGKIDMGDFKSFEEEKVLEKRCNLSYDMIPQNLFDSVEKNINVTYDFFTTASKENALEVLDHNRRTTESYLEMVNQFIDSFNKNISGNNCFKGKARPGMIARATFTPVQYKIGSDVIIDYARKANSNVEILMEEVSERRNVLFNGTGTSFEENTLELSNSSFDKEEEVISSEEAVKEFNSRRVSEYFELYFENETDERETVDQEGGEEESNLSFPEEELDKVRKVENEPRLFVLETNCLEDETVPVYGWNRNVYPNIINGFKSRYRDVETNDEIVYVNNIFSTCKCPYAEITRLEWYVVNDIYREMKKRMSKKDLRNTLSTKFIEKTGLTIDISVESNDNQVFEKIERSEKMFLNSPGSRSLEQLSNVYAETLGYLLGENVFDKKIPYLWKTRMKSESRLQEFKSVYDDFYNDEHMEVWNKFFLEEDYGNFTQTKYNYFFLSESLYPLKMMTWSETVWMPEEKPKKYSGELN